MKTFKKVGVVVLAMAIIMLAGCVLVEKEVKFMHYYSIDCKDPEDIKRQNFPEDIEEELLQQVERLNNTKTKNCDKALTELENEGCVETSGPITVPIGT